MESENVIGLLRKSVEEIIQGEAEVAVAYSGGLDSSIVAAIAKEFSRVQCYTCAVRGSFDARHSQARANTESLSLTIIDLTREVLIKEILSAMKILESANPVQIAYTIPVLRVVGESREKIVLAGSGADELFGGYAKYRSSGDAERMMAEDLLKMLEEASKLEKAAGMIGKRIGFPFVSEKLIEFSRSIPLERKIGSPERKIILRDVAKQLQLPSRETPKKAAQYSSGVLREMRNMARLERKSISEWINGIARSGSRSA